MRRKTTLFVYGHLENISSEAFEKYQGVIRALVRRRPGVYALYRREKLYYVGLAGNLRIRLKAHLKDRHRNLWDRFSVYLTVSDAHLRELEALVLRIVKPTGNKQRGKFAQSEDLRRRFARDIRQQQRLELGTLIGRHAENVDQDNPPESGGRKAVLMRYSKGRIIRLRARFKGKLLRARVRRDGQIRFRSVLYSSPSLAGAAACQRRTCNGCKFWEFERSKGDWVSLDELRR